MQRLLTFVCVLAALVVAHPVNADTLSDLIAQRASVQRQLEAIGDSPRLPNENLNEEIQRKRNESRQLRRRLGTLNEQIANLERQRQLDESETTAPEGTPVLTLESQGQATEAAEQAAGPSYDPAHYRHYGEGGRPLDGPSPNAVGGQTDISDEQSDDTIEWVTNDTMHGHGLGTRTTQNPNSRGWWTDKDGKPETTYWREMRTDCAPCKHLVEQFNWAMERVMWARGSIVEMQYDKRRSLQRAREQLRHSTTTNTGTRQTDGSLTASAFHAATALTDLEEAHDALIAAERRELEFYERMGRQLAAQIAECERQCSDSDGETTGITTGWGNGWINGDRTSASGTSPLLPFNWRGPYSTDCPRCVRIAQRLNELPELAYKEIHEIVKRQIWIDQARARLMMDNAQFGLSEGAVIDPSSRDSDDERTTPAERRENMQETTERWEGEIANYQARLRRITEYFPEALQALQDCEREHCSNQTPDRRVGLVPSYGADGSYCSSPEVQRYLFGAALTGQDVDRVRQELALGAAIAGMTPEELLILCGMGGLEVELDYVVSISGTNPLDPREIERIPGIVNGTETVGTTTTTGTTGTTTTTGTGTTTTDTGTTTTDTGTTDTGATTTTTTPSTPLVVTASGVVTFAHTVGTSPCPQSAGTISISSNNGNNLTVSGVSVSGTLSTRLNTTVNGSGTATPSITVQFNCSSSDNGTFTGTITGTVTDASTGETSTFTINATGTVTG